MMPGIGRLRADLRRNAVALISLVVALAALGYTTWRNETTESQRSVRTAAFASLESLAGLQVIVDARRYQDDRQRGDYIAGWAKVLLIRDLAVLLPAPGPAAAQQLHETWQANFGGWYEGNDPAAEQRISRAIRDARAAVLAVLAGLE